MARVLRAAWVAPSAGQEAAYLQQVAVTRGAVEAEGGHVWLFRSRHAPARFLEFVEVGAGPGGAPALSPDTMRALDHLAAIDARRDAAPDPWWDEVELATQ